MSIKTVLLALVLFVVTLFTLQALDAPGPVQSSEFKVQSSKFLPAPILAQATAEETAAAIRTKLWAKVKPVLTKFALFVGVIHLTLFPIVAAVRRFMAGLPASYHWSGWVQWATALDFSKVNRTVPLFLLSTFAFLLLGTTGCVGYTPGALTKQLKDDHATVSVHVVTPWGTQRIIRTNPGSNQTSTINVDGSVTVQSR